MKKETLYNFYDRRATPAEKEEVKQWIEDSSGNIEEFIKEREFFSAMILSGGMNAEQIKSNTVDRKKPRRHLFIEFLKVAAIAIIAIAASFYFQHYINKVSSDQNLLTVTVPPGQRVNLTLPDGTDIWLNARTQLRYPGVFKGDKREIYLNGEAYLDVKHQKGQPFIVHTSKCAVEVLGTKFNIEDYADSKDFSTALFEGSVKVSDNEQAKNTVTLSADQLAIFDGGKLIVDKISDFDYYRWRDGLVAFKDMGFEQLMQRFEKCYGIQIVIENEALKEYGFSGKFRISDGIDNALRVLQRDAPYTFRKDEDENVIYIK